MAASGTVDSQGDQSCWSIISMGSRIHVLMERSPRSGIGAAPADAWPRRRRGGLLAPGLTGRCAELAWQTNGNTCHARLAYGNARDARLPLVCNARDAHLPATHMTAGNEAKRALLPCWQ